MKIVKKRNGLYSIGFYDIIRNDEVGLWQIYSHKERRVIHIGDTLRDCKKWLSKNVDLLELR